MSLSLGNVGFENNKISLPVPVVGANNGLTLDVPSKNIELGGTLIRNTDVQINGFDFTMGSAWGGMFKLSEGSVDGHTPITVIDGGYILLGKVPGDYLRIRQGLPGSPTVTLSSSIDMTLSAGSRIDLLSASGTVNIGSDIFSVSATTGMSVISDQYYGSYSSLFNIYDNVAGQNVFNLDLANKTYSIGDLGDKNTGLKMIIKDDGVSPYLVDIRDKNQPYFASILKLTPTTLVASIGPFGDTNSTSFFMNANNGNINFGTGLNTNLTINNNGIYTSAPGATTSPLLVSKAWRLGEIKSATVVLDTANYVEISIDGIIHKLALVN